MNIRIFPFLFILLVTLITSCTGENKLTVNDPQFLVEEDTLSIVSTVANDTMKKAHEVREFKENLKVIEQKYGEQWGFCECVVANDSLDRAFKVLIDFETPEAELLLSRFEFISKKCQAFLGMDASRTPEQREIHQKKVKNCLKNVRK